MPVTPEMTAWVEQQEAALVRAGLQPYAGWGDSSFRWGLSALEPRPVSLRHTKRDFVQAHRRLVAEMRANADV